MLRMRSSTNLPGTTRQTKMAEEEPMDISSSSPSKGSEKTSASAKPTHDLPWWEDK